RLSRAKQEAIRPLPEIGTTTELLVARVGELEQTLGHGTPTSRPQFAPQELFLRVQEAATLEELAALRVDLEASNRIGFLHESALAEAYRLIQEACWKLYSTQPESKVGQKDGGWQNMLPLHVLQRSLRQGESCLLLIDGHNVLFRLMSILQLDFERNSPGSRARQQLVDKVSALAARFQCIDIHLWYDGEDAHDISVSRNLVVHYSGGLGRNRADAEIVNYLHSIDYMRAKQQSRLKVLVSADKGLSDAARLQGAAIVLAPEELAILLSLPNR
ncbi:MAG: NYN domain-containing protein, partial [Proteobacteria bacterium]|nr:NYN domain-containing protein [Pseudomonadota bacterium]